MEANETKGKHNNDAIARQRITKQMEHRRSEWKSLLITQPSGSWRVSADERGLHPTLAATDVDEVMLTRLVKALDDGWNGAVETGYEDLDKVSGRKIVLEMVVPSEFARSDDEDALTSVCKVTAEVITMTNCDDKGRTRKKGR